LAILGIAWLVRIFANFAPDAGAHARVAGVLALSLALFPLRPVTSRARLPALYSGSIALVIALVLGRPAL